MIIQAFAKQNQTNYQKRVQQVLNWADTTKTSNFLIAGAKIRSGNETGQAGLFIGITLALHFRIQKQGKGIP